MARMGPFEYEFKLSQRNYDFDTQMDTIIANTQAKMLVVVKSALSDTIEEMQKTTAQGGQMRLDTGFLRNSGVGAVNQLPSGESVGRKRRKGEVGVLSEYSDNNIDSVNLKIAELEIGDTFYFGWTANYAKIREAYDGFLETGLQKWQANVNAAVGKIKRL